MKINDVIKKLKLNDVIKKLKQINHNTLTLIEKMFEKLYENTVKINNFSNDMLKLISLSAPVHKNLKIQSHYNKSNLSPIVTGKPKDSINIDNTEVYNIFGHIPSGMGYSISKSDNTYSINTDTSNGLLKTDYLINKDKYNDNYLLLFLDSNCEFKLKGEIFVNSDNIIYHDNVYDQIINYPHNSNIVIQNLSNQKNK